MVSGLSHLTFIVRDLDRMEAVLTQILGARRVYDSAADTFSLSPERFFVVGDDDLWLAIMEGDPLPTRSYNHVAFQIDEDEYDECLARIRSLHLEFREGRPRIAGEGRSIYFYDDDNHLFELHTGTLDARLQAYRSRR
ncbi:MAG: FosX/FosE/FosI family fosfomycin resistance hydrolase [Myxococcota bacterium]